MDYFCHGTAGLLGHCPAHVSRQCLSPIPSEIIMPSAGYSASQGELLLVGVIIAGSIGSLLAAALLYWIGYKFNHDSIFRFVDKYGKFLFIKSEDVKNL